MGSSFNQLSNIVNSKKYREIQNIVGFSTLAFASVDIILENDFLSL